MTLSGKALWLVLVTAVLIIIATGCNDTLRQFITPVPAPSGDPGAFAHAIVLSTNPATPTNTNPALGTDLHIDVSGDTVVGVVQVGLNPLFLGRTSNRVLVLNQGNGSDIPPTVSSYIGLLPSTSPVTTITLPTGTIPQAGAFSSTGNFYLVNSGSLDPANPSANNAGVISGAVNAVTATIPVGSNPVAIAGNSANNKIYVVNHDSDTVTVVSTIDNFVSSTISTADMVNHPNQRANPIWGVMAPDGVHVFIVNQGDGLGDTGWISVIDTFLDVVIANIEVGVSPNYAVFEPNNQRVYVSNTGSSFISVIKANGIDLAQHILPTLIANIQIPAPANSVAALPDGTRAYATLSGCPTGTNHTTIINDIATSCNGNQVAVIDTLSLTSPSSKLLTVGPGAVSIDAASNSSRVYVISAKDITTISDDVTPPPNPPQTRTFTTPSVSVINTTTDTVLRQTVDAHIISLVPTFHVPQQDPACVPTIDPTFNHTVPIPCPLQVPFQVRVFP